MPYSFGKTIKYTFYPLKDEIAHDDFEDASVFASPTIYIFDVKPDRTTASAGTGAVQTISSWTATSDGSGKVITIDPIDDPEPTNTKGYQSFYIAINFSLESGEQTQTLVRLLPMQRVEMHASTALPIDEDLNAIHPDINKFFTTTEIESAIKVARNRAKGSLKGAGFEWSEIWNPDQLKDWISYLALSQLAVSQGQGGGWSEKYEEYRIAAESLKDGIIFLIDKDKDGEPEKVAQAVTVYNLIR